MVVGCQRDGGSSASSFCFNSCLTLSKTYITVRNALPLGTFKFLSGPSASAVNVCALFIKSIYIEP